MRWVILVLLLSLPVFAGEIKIFLSPSYSMEDSIPALSDIAHISGSSSSIVDIRLTRIHRSAYSDGFIDRSEVQQMLLPFQDDITIYGNGVRLLPRERDNKGEKKGIAKGDTVTVRIRKNGVLIETRGRALRPARHQERVDIQLKNNRRLRGVVTDEQSVEVGS